MNTNNEPRFTSRKWIHSIINDVLGTAFCALIAYFLRADEIKLIWIAVIYLGFLGLNSGLFNLFNHLEKLWAWKGFNNK